MISHVFILASLIGSLYYEGISKESLINNDVLFAMFMQHLLNASSTYEAYEIANNFMFHQIDAEDVELYIYSETGPELYNSENEKHLVNFSAPTKVIIHGWISGGNNYTAEMATAYNSIGVTNVFAVYWGKHSEEDYYHAASVTRDVGKHAANLLLNLIQNDTQVLSNFHLIGHSLGAHICGIVGKEITKMTRAKIGRITGLEVARPLFEFPVEISNDSRVISSDANYVDIIHTNGGLVGFASPIGTADIYLNNGCLIQEVCWFFNIYFAFECSHSWSHEMFIESIATKNYSSVACTKQWYKTIFYNTSISTTCPAEKRTIILGEHATPDIIGTFYVSNYSSYINNLLCF